jgi:RES domain-containing protein
MTVYRFVLPIYRNDISGDGARKKGGRWNSPGFPVVYTSTAISLSLLELLIYNSSYEEIRVNMLMQITVPENLMQSLSVNALKQTWQKDIDYSRFIGNEFLKTKKSLLLNVPSAIIPEETNVLINPAHPDFKRVKIINAAPFQFDTRLFK